MPMYEFECAQCGARFEELMDASAETSPECPGCGASSAKRLMSAGSVRPHGVPKGRGGFEPPACSSGAGGCKGCGVSFGN